jgi:hypothetical protein
MESDLVVHLRNPSTHETEAGGSLIQVQPRLYSKFQASLSQNKNCIV